MSGRIARHDQQGVCTLTLDRPEKLNALDTAAFEALEAHLSALEGDEAVACVVLRGAGRGFCAGADLEEVGAGPKPPLSYKAAIVDRLARLPKPTIAAVHGACFTGGLELALACDFILADGTARFADTHGKWGLVASWGMGQRLPRRVGIATAKRLMMTSRVVAAAEALELGLVDLLAPEGGLDALVEGLTRDICANSAFTNAAVKRFAIETDGLSLAEGLAHELAAHPGRAPDYLDRLERFRR
jgi:enoyl-CoA hydratase/carnithine racemase